MFRFIRATLSVLVTILYTTNAWAQPMLPDITGSTSKGLNILSWECQYDGIKSIAVQRSSDSIYNYVTLGLVKNLKKGPQAYIDGHPKPGKNWYRLYIIFNSELTWYSNRFAISVDSIDIINAQVLAPNDSLQKLTANIKIEPIKANTSEDAPQANTVVIPKVEVAPRITLDIPEEASEDGVAYIKSQYIYTNPFTGHVNIDIPNYTRHHYAVTFLNNDNKQVLEIERVSTPMIILDKRNFQKKGIYKFELLEDRKMLETGYITIY